MKNFLINSSIVLLSFIIGIIFLEIGVRVFHLESDLFTVLDTCIGHKRIPNKNGYNIAPDFKVYTEMNNEGFRDVNHTIDKGEGIYRIVILGDSMTEGMQVPLEYTIPKLIEELFLDDVRNVEIISLGMFGFGTGQELLALECYGLQYQPDLVVLNFFTGNDVNNNYFETSPFAPHFSLEDGELVLDTSYRINIQQRIDGENLSISFRILKFIKDNSFLARMVRHRLAILHVTFQGNTVEYDPIFNTIYDEEMERAWELTKVLITKTATISQENNADFLLIQIPSPFEYGQDGNLGNNDKKFNFQKPRMILSSFANENSIQYLDLLPLFENVGNVSFEDVSWSHDGHFNRKGNELVAQFTYNLIINSF
jgi:lysophospholipase L1-like esterase